MSKLLLVLFLNTVGLTASFVLITKEPRRIHLESTFTKSPDQNENFRSILHSSVLNNDATINSLSVSETDQETIQDQLGYIPSNLLSVSARRGVLCNNIDDDKKNTDEIIIGTPLALKTYPLNGGANRRKNKAQGKLTPFPTLYWFCCPIVGKAVAELERRGFVGKFENRLVEEPGAWKKFIESHEGYAKERWETLELEHQDMLDNGLEGTNLGMRDMVRYSGIAGTDFKSFALLPRGDDGEGMDDSKKPSIKCLHAHYAHYRSQLASASSVEGKQNVAINIVGEWIHEALQEEFPGMVL